MEAEPPGSPALVAGALRLGLFDHFGWAVAVTASADYQVVDRRRIELIDAGLPQAPIHHVGGVYPMHRGAQPADDGTLAALVARVRASATRVASAELDNLAAALPAQIVSLSLRRWPTDFPEDIATLRRVPYESRADSIMYRHVLAEIGHDRGWRIHL